MRGKTKLRDLSETELEQKAKELREEVFNLRFQVSMAMAKNPARIGQVRRELARVQTIQRERALGMRMPAQHAGLKPGFGVADEDYQAESA